MSNAHEEKKLDGFSMKPSMASSKTMGRKRMMLQERSLQIYSVNQF